MTQPAPQPIPADKALEAEYALLGIEKAERTALCLSGGGIRSAAFCLGVVQGLARLGVLKQFHYLSTVSGGGYTGGYLSARLHTLNGDSDKLQAELQQGGNAAWLTRLRQSGNFLTPQLGLFSLDTWTGLTLYVRNLLLTWASLLPWTLLLVLAFIFYRTLIAVAGREHWLAFLFLAIGAAGLALSTYWLCTGLPSHHREGEQARSSSWPAFPSPGLVAGIAMAWPMLVPFGFGVWKDVGATEPAPLLIAGFAPLKLGAAYAVIVYAAFLAAWARAPAAVRPRYRSNWWTWLLATLFSAVLTALGPWLLHSQVSADGQVEVLAVLGPAWLALAMIIHAGTYMGLRRNAPAATAELDREWTARMSARIQLLSVAIALVGFPILALPDVVVPPSNAAWTSGEWRNLLTPLISGPAVAWLGHQAFTRMAALNELDAGWREKAIDLGIALLAGVFLAFVLAVSSAVLQSYVLGPLQQGIVRTMRAVPPGGGPAGFATVAWDRIRAWEPVPDCAPPRPAEAPAKAPPVCRAAPATACPPADGSAPAPWCLGTEVLQGCAAAPLPPCQPVAVPIWLMLALQVVTAALLGLAALVLRIDNNRFTLHAVYRNRLVRGFLGPAREPQDPRHPEPVTGFDPHDDVRLAALGRHFQEGQAQGTSRPLFPVVNIAVNVTRTANPLWAERKALSFTATPLHCGYYLPSVDPAAPGAAIQATYLPTPHFNHSLRGEPDRTAEQDKGLGLGTAMTVSGAAASPNSGYHSRPATAFLMTLFNVRLGLWAPNTRLPSPRAGLTAAEQRRALLNDLRGNSSLDGKAIYLSDGGHFDNLGLYEMLRRRCTFIVVVDAAHDPHCSFADLGQSLRKAAIDLGATVSLTATRIGPRKEGVDNKDLLGLALGEISYPAAEGQEAAKGQLLYVKPTWLAKLPMDVRAYGAAEKEFPQQPTSDQWFSESQFESYRSLGTHQLQVLHANPDRPEIENLTLAELFARARTLLDAAPAA